MGDQRAQSRQGTLEVYSDSRNGRHWDPNTAGHGVETLQFTAQHSPVYAQNRSRFYVCCLKNTAPCATARNLASEHGLPRAPTGRQPITANTTLAPSEHAPSTNPESTVDMTLPPPRLTGPCIGQVGGVWEQKRASDERLVCSSGRPQKTTTVPLFSEQTHLPPKAKLGCGWGGVQC